VLASSSELFMKDVFVSYKREDESRVAGVVESLRQAGLSVAWDLDIPGGANWRQTLLDYLDSARCVIVVWSEASAGPAGEFVHEEASRAKARGVLLPVRIDTVEEPLGFGQIQSMDLVGWAGDADDPRFRDVVAGAKAVIAGGLRPEPRASRQRPRAAHEFFNSLVGVVPEYLGDVLALTSGPKRFVADRLAKRESRWQEGFLFFAISFTLTFAVCVPFVRTDALHELISDAPFVAAYVVLFGYATFFAWRLVGATAPIQPFFLIHFYFAGVLKLMLTATFMVGMGVLRGGDPALYQQVIAAAAGGDFLGLMANAHELFVEHPAWRVTLLVCVGGYGAMFAWVVIGWGAYRKLAGVGKLRSFLAFVLYCVFCVPIYALTLALATAVTR
jgi:hypothetical protein